MSQNKLDRPKLGLRGPIGEAAQARISEQNASLEARRLAEASQQQRLEAEARKCRQQVADDKTSQAAAAAAAAVRQIALHREQIITRAINAATSVLSSPPADAIVPHKSIAFEDIDQAMALHWTRHFLKFADAENPAGYHKDARYAELAAMRWLMSNDWQHVTDISIEAMNCLVEDEEADHEFYHYDIRATDTAGSVHRFDVKNTSWIAGGKVFSRKTPRHDVALIGTYTDKEKQTATTTILGLLMSSDYREMAQFEAELAKQSGHGSTSHQMYDTNQPKHNVRSASVPSWMFHYPDDIALKADTIADKMRELEFAIADPQPRMLNTHIALRLFVSPELRDRWDVTLPEVQVQDEFLRISDKAAVSPWRLRHLYIFTLDHFRRNFNSQGFVSGVYREAFLLDSSASTGFGLAYPADSAFKPDFPQMTRAHTRGLPPRVSTLPVALWDPSGQYAILLKCLMACSKLGDRLPPIEALIVTRKGTIIANPAGGVLSKRTLLARCDGEQQGNPCGRLLYIGESETDESTGRLRCAICGHVPGYQDGIT